VQLENSRHDVTYRTSSPVLASARKVAEACLTAAPDLDQTGTVSQVDLQPFIRSGLLSLPVGSTGCVGSTAKMLEVLMIIGSGDLSLGRLYEGHLNAVLLVHRFGRPDLQRRVECAIRRGALLGVWNTDAARPLKLIGAASGFHLDGGKAFASGAGLVELAVIIARLSDGRRQMLLIPTEHSGIRVDPSSWRPLGMRASMSFTVDLTGITVDEQAFVGNPDDYTAEPWFTAGCLRFAAVQLGGAFAIAQVVHTHLRQTGREKDINQERRFARMWVGIQSGRLQLAHAATMAEHASIAGEKDSTAVIAVANAARYAVEEASQLVMNLAARSIGLCGMQAPHPFERLLRDLTTYLRQPGPDAALASVGHAALAADYLPW
jgi:alkylation response protein AidB-like acyl-CoA dehydrogenase